jgi:hypothetical protein
MGLLLSGIASAAFSYFILKKYSWILTLASIAPLLFAFFTGLIKINADPSSVAQVNNNVVLPAVKYITSEMGGIPGGMLFGSVVGLFKNDE